MPSPIVLGKQGHVLAFKPNQGKSDETTALPVQEVTREMTLPFFAQ